MYHFLKDCENSTCSPEPEEESLAASFSDIPPSVLSRLSLIAEKSCSSGNETESCQSSPSGMTSEPSTEPLGADSLTLFAEDSPVRTSASQGEARELKGSRSGLWSEMERIIRDVRPKYVFVENSPALVIRGLGRVLSDLAEMGFDAKWGVLSAQQAGACHERERIWIVATHPDRAQREGGWLPGGVYQEQQDIGSNTWWEAEPAVCRVDDGLARRLDRLRAIGNGQVPAVAALAWETLTQ